MSEIEFLRKKVADMADGIRWGFRMMLVEAKRDRGRLKYWARYKRIGRHR